MVSLSRLALLASLLLAGLHVPAAAEKADRGKPMVVDADKPATLDMQRQVLVFSGNVVVTQGTLSLKAERIEVREAPDGQRAATALGTAERQAAYRQKRDALNEWVEGSADRIEFDARSDTLKFLGSASVRRLRGTEVADEISGAIITWDNTAGLFSVAGGVPSPANPSGRIRAVLAPRGEMAASAAPPAEATPLRPSRTLGDRK